ncbi:hypothetical protein D3C77_166450 [compost metagenome]
MCVESPSARKSRPYWTGGSSNLKITLNMNQKIDLQPTDYFGVHYLLLPVVLFFGFYTTAAIAIPSVIFLIYCISRLRLKQSLNPSSHALLALNAAVSAAVVINSGAAGPLYVNGDWIKHYAIFNELVRHDSIAEQSFTLRYYIGAYIVPSFAEKAIGFSNGIILASWVALGLFIFLNQLSTLITSARLKYIAPFIFLLFSGADLLGYYITGFQRGNINHLEWWAGWVEYSSPITSMFWAPQSTIPAWISIAFLIRRPTIEQKLFVSPLILMSCLLWSPFAAIGIAPYLLLTLVHAEFKAAYIKVIHLMGVAFLSALICYYLTFDVDEIPKHWVWNNPCLVNTPGEPCFTISGYLIFMLLEVIPVYALAMTSKASRSPIIYISLAILAFLPLTQLGLYNDLAMNASKPALAALIIGMIIALQDGSNIRRILCALVMAAGIATPVSESLRSFEFNRHIETNADITSFVEQSPEFSKQYVTTERVWFLRRE